MNSATMGVALLQVEDEGKAGGLLTFPDRPAAPVEPAWLGQVRVSVVIPAMNEAANLPHVLPRIPPWVHEVILVDGASTDGTAEVARRLRPDIRVVQQRGRGKGDALRAGFAAAEGEIVAMLDADGSTDPTEIPAYVGALLSGADFAKGTRFIQGAGTSDMQWYRALGNFGFVLLVRLLFAGQYTDLCYGYNAFWRRVLPALQLDGSGFEIETMMNVRALKAGLVVAEVPSFEHRRIYGVSRLRTIPDGMRVLRTIFRERLTRTTRAMQPGALETDGARLAVIVPVGASARVTLPVETGPVADGSLHVLATATDSRHVDATGGARAEAAVAR